jgi:uncharacterized membrane protein YfcA
MPELAPLAVAAAAIVVFAACVVRGMSGFGTSLIAIPLLVLLMPIHAAVPLMALLGLAVMLMLGIRDRGHVRWEEMWRLLWPTLAGVFAGVYVFSMLDARLMQKLLGVFIAAYAVYMIVAQFAREPAGNCSARWAYPAGFAGSLIDSMFGGGGGLLVVIYMHRRGYAVIAFRATLAVLWLLELIVRVGGYALSGFYDTNLLVLALLLAPAVFAGNRVGERITRTISQQAFARLLAVVLMAAAVNLLLR